MAGGVLKSFGATFLALGILLVLVGGGMAIYGLADENQNRDHSGPLGVGHDRDRAETNQQIEVAGGAAAALGVLLAIVGGILLGAGSGRANRALVKAVAGRGTEAPVVQKAPTSLAPTQPAAAASLPVVAPATRSAPSAPVAPTLRRSRRSFWVAAGLGMAGVLVAVLLVTMATVGGNPAALFGASHDNAQPPAPLGSTTLQGTVSSGPTVAGMSQLAGDGKAPSPFLVPDGTTRIEVKPDWAPGTSCCAHLQIDLDQSRDGATWTAHDSHTVAPGQAYNVTVTAADGAHFQFRVFPGDDGFSTRQDYTVTVTFWK